MEDSKAEKIKRYESEEIKFILFICATDLSGYDDEDLTEFAEAIEGSVEVLFNSKKLMSLANYFDINPKIISDFGYILTLLKRLYAPQWHNKLKSNDVNRDEIRLLAIKILRELNISYVEPNEYRNTHLSIDW